MIFAAKLYAGYLLFPAKADTDRDATYQEPVAPVVPVYDTPTYDSGKPGKLKVPSLDKLLDPSNEVSRKKSNFTQPRTGKIRLINVYFRK